MLHSVKMKTMKYYQVCQSTQNHARIDFEDTFARRVLVFTGLGNGEFWSGIRTRRDNETLGGRFFLYFGRSVFLRSFSNFLLCFSACFIARFSAACSFLSAASSFFFCFATSLPSNSFVEDSWVNNVPNLNAFGRARGSSVDFSIDFVGGYFKIVASDSVPGCSNRWIWALRSSTSRSSEMILLARIVAVGCFVLRPRDVRTRFSVIKDVAMRSGLITSGSTGQVPHAANAFLIAFGV